MRNLFPPHMHDGTLGFHVLIHTGSTPLLMDTCIRHLVTTGATSNYLSYLLSMGVSLCTLIMDGGWWPSSGWWAILLPSYSKKRTAAPGSGRYLLIPSDSDVSWLFTFSQNPDNSWQLLPSSQCGFKYLIWSVPVVVAVPRYSASGLIPRVHDLKS